MGKVLIAIPSGDTMPIATVNSIMHLLRRVDDEFRICTGSLVYDARNHLVNEALEGGFEYVLFIDSDMVFPSNTLQKLMSDDKDVVSALCFGRVGSHPPCSYTKIKKGNKKKSGSKEPLTDFTEPLVKIEGCGMAVCLIKTEVFKKMLDKCGEWFEPKWNLGEDLAFCERCKEIGVEIWCDTTLRIGHVGTAIYGIDDYVRA